jgi:argininosuccinate lyase
MILYASAEFGYVDLPEEFCTGSSLMPHKKNADLLELIRGHSGTVCGDLTALLVTMKGLPLTYNRDMQLDKEPLFRSTELLLRELDLTARFVPGVRLREEKIAADLEDEHLYGVEIAEYLVHRKVPFKSAHDIVGGLIRYSEEHGVRIRDIPDAELAAFHPALSRKKLRKIMTPGYVTASRKT